MTVAWRRALVAACVLRLGVALVTVVAPGLLAGGDPVTVAALPGFAGWTAGPAAGLGLVGAGLERFDALWYLAIAADGYPATDVVPQAAAFFPGYPLLVAAVALPFGGRLLLAAQLVAFVATVAALAGVHELAHDAARRWGGRWAEDADGLARRAVVLLACFPTAFFLVAPYSESTFLAVTTWALVLAGRGRWAGAAALGLAAGAVRPLGATLVLPVLLLALSPRAEGRVRRGPALVAVAAPLLGVAVVAGAAWARYGDPLAVLQVQAAWQRAPSWPWTTLASAVESGLRFGSWWALDLVVVLPVLAAFAWLVVRDRVLGLYAMAHVAVWFVVPFADRPLLSVPRLAVAVAPLALVLAAWTRVRGAETSAVAVQSGLLALHLALFTTWGLVF